MNRFEEIMETKRFKVLAFLSFPLSFWFIVGGVILRRLWGLTENDVMRMGDHIGENYE